MSSYVLKIKENYYFRIWIPQDLQQHKAGYAWWYRKYSSDASLGELEKEARKARRGLWQDKDPMAPWEWRKMKRTKSKRT